MARWLVAAVRVVYSVGARVPLSEYLDTLLTSQPRFFGCLHMEWQLVWIHSGQAPSQRLGVGFGLAASKVARRVSTGTDSR